MHPHQSREDHGEAIVLFLPRGVCMRWALLGVAAAAGLRGPLTFGGEDWMKEVRAAG